jgi:hypothetical protein
MASRPSQPCVQLTDHRYHFYEFGRSLARAEQVRVYNKTVELPGARGFDRTMYESYCQEQFRTGIHIVYTAMVRLLDTEGLSPTKRIRQDETTSERSPSVKGPQWHTTHSILGGDLEAQRLDTLSQKQSLSVNPTAVVEYSEVYITSETIKEGIFYIPDTKNQVALDSLIIHLGTLFLFQFTVGKSHKIKEGLISLLEKASGLPLVGSTRLIFVIPGDVVMTTLARSPKLAKINLHSSVLEVEE